MKRGSIMASLLTISLLVFSGCSSAAPSQDATPSKKVQTSESASVNTTKSQQAASSTKTTTQANSNNIKTDSIPTNLVSATVVKDVDGDTIEVNLYGKVETIRMLLIDTPEDVDPRKPVEPFGYQAAGYAKSVFPAGKQIYLELGKQGHDRDKYNRLLAYIYITPTDMYNMDVVAKGLARVAYIYPPNTEHLADLQSAESKAKSQKLGIWSLSGYATPSGYNLALSCEYAKKNGFSTKGCGSITSSYPTSRTTTSNQTTTKNNTSTVSAKSALAVNGSTLSVTHGQEASVTVKTNAGAKGTIEVDYKSGPSHAAGLEPKTADTNGTITWTWKVGSSTTPGTYPVIIKVNGSTIQKTITVN